MRGRWLELLVELALLVKLDVELALLVTMVKLQVVLMVVELAVLWMWMVRA